MKELEKQLGLAPDALLLAAIEDTEATIRAIDTKASIALVVHGFIFTGVLSVFVRLGSAFDSATCTFRALIVVLSGFAALTFLASVVQIVRCVRPAPKSVVPVVPSGNLFFLPVTANAISAKPSTSLSFDALRQKAREVIAPEITDELAGELYKVSAIRARKAALSSAGLALLAFEVGLCLTLLAVLGIHQLASI